MSLVQLSHNLLKNIISGPVDGPKHTPNKFDDKRTYIWCQCAIHNKFCPTAFSRSVQTPLVRPGFDAVVCVLCINAHTTDDGGRTKYIETKYIGQNISDKIYLDKIYPDKICPDKNIFRQNILRQNMLRQNMLRQNIL